MPTISAASYHADTVAASQALAQKTGMRLWRNLDHDSIGPSWRFAVSSLTLAVSAIQQTVAISATEVGAAELAEQGVYRAPLAFADPSSFAGVAPDGRSLEGLLESPSYRARTLIGSGAPVDDALDKAGERLSTILRTVVADTARQAMSVDIATRRGVGYTRVVVGETCPDCVILAGRFYRWNAGFKRHPGCDCIHQLTTQALSSQAITDPYEHFNSLTEAEQNEFWGHADAQAIRDGADIYQVYNSRRGRSADHMTTLANTSMRGLMPNEVRLTPDGIYAQATSRAEALQLLEVNKYILPGGQTPGGVLRGNVDGFAGYMGRGGTRIGATEAFREALRTGARDGSLATMTAAERRLFNATANWQAVTEGRNPYSATKPLTPQIAADVERNYRRWLRTGGQVFA